MSHLRPLKVIGLANFTSRGINVGYWYIPPAPSAIPRAPIVVLCIGTFIYFSHIYTLYVVLTPYIHTPSYY